MLIIYLDFKVEKWEGINVEICCTSNLITRCCVLGLRNDNVVVLGRKGI